MPASDDDRGLPKWLYLVFVAAFAAIGVCGFMIVRSANTPQVVAAELNAPPKTEPASQPTTAPTPHVEAEHGKLLVQRIADDLRANPPRVPADGVWSVGPSEPEPEDITSAFFAQRGADLSEPFTSWQARMARLLPAEEFDRTAEAMKAAAAMARNNAEEKGSSSAIGKRFVTKVYVTFFGGDAMTLFSLTWRDKQSPEIALASGFYEVFGGEPVNKKTQIAVLPRIRGALEKKKPPANEQWLLGPYEDIKSVSDVQPNLANGAANIETLVRRTRIIQARFNGIASLDAAMGRWRETLQGIIQDDEIARAVSAMHQFLADRQSFNGVGIQKPASVIGERFITRARVNGRPEKYTITLELLWIDPNEPENRAAWAEKSQTNDDVHRN